MELDCVRNPYRDIILVDEMMEIQKVHRSIRGRGGASGVGGGWWGAPGGGGWSIRGGVG